MRRLAEKLCETTHVGVFRPIEKQVTTGGKAARKVSS